MVAYSFQRRILLAAVFTLAAGTAAAQRGVEVVDGDTIRLGSQTIRVMGMDTPELRGACTAERELAQRARDRLAQLLAGGVTLQPRGMDRYRRVLAVVRDRRGRDLAEVLIAEGLARPYDGRGPRAGWC
jgi:endonuclease YncB( thermonuclease family)